MTAKMAAPQQISRVAVEVFTAGMPLAEVGVLMLESYALRGKQIATKREMGR